VNKSKTLNRKNSGKIIILVAPSGAGKTTIARRLLKDFKNLRFSVSATTRPPRSGEKKGVDYFFLTPDEFSDSIEAGDFLEWEEFYNGNRYGTLRSDIEKKMGQGYSVLLDIEVLGASNIKKIYGDQALSFFIKPPSMKALKERLERRGTESQSTLKDRLERANKELEYEGQFDMTIINDDLEEAYRQVRDAVEDFIDQDQTKPGA